MAAGDFDLNGIDDLAVVRGGNAASPGGVRIVLFTDTGEVADQSEIAVSTRIIGFHAVDLDGDAVLDLVLGTIDDTLRTYLGDGLGGFVAT